MSVEDALACGLFEASGAFAAGMSCEPWLASRPDVRGRLGIEVGRFAVALASEMVEEGPGPTDPPPNRAVESRPRAWRTRRSPAGRPSPSGA